MREFALARDPFTKFNFADCSSVRGQDHRQNFKVELAAELKNRGVKMTPAVQKAVEALSEFGAQRFRSKSPEYWQKLSKMLLLNPLEESIVRELYDRAKRTPPGATFNELKLIVYKTDSLNTGQRLEFNAALKELQDSKVIFKKRAGGSNERYQTTDVTAMLAELELNLAKDQAAFNGWRKIREALSRADARANRPKP